MRVFVSHPSDKLDGYFGAEAAAALAAFAEVRTNPEPRELATAALAAARLRGADRLPADAGAGSAVRGAACARCLRALCRRHLHRRRRCGVLVTQASAGFVAAVSEWVIAVMIDLARGISRSAEAYHRGDAAWPTMGRELRGATLGIVGFGRIGRAVAELAAAFGMRVVVSDPHVGAAAGTASMLPLAALLAASDFVVCLATAGADTEKLIDGAAFAAMKRGAIFVNASRGELVDEAALLAALDSGRLAGCAVDVGLAADQMPSPAVARHPLVIATPHIGGLTRTATSHQACETVAQIKAPLQGRLPPGAVNANEATRLRR